MNFKFKSAMWFGIVHFIFACVVSYYVARNYYSLNQEFQSANSLTALFIVYTLLLIIDFPVTAIYLLIVLNCDVHEMNKSLETWKVAVVLYIVLGSLWWCVIGGYWRSGLKVLSNGLSKFRRK